MSKIGLLLAVLLGPPMLASGMADDVAITAFTQNEWTHQLNSCANDFKTLQSKQKRHRRERCSPCPQCPPGAQGPQGPTGSIGPTGPTGPSEIEPSFTVSQIILVNKGGNDANGTGTDEKPFLTISFAMSQITDASPTKRYLISVGPGTYAEDVTVKANVFIAGSAPVLTRVNSINISDASWGDNDDHRSGLKNIQVLGTTDIDFVAQQSIQGKFYIFASRLTEDLTVSACNPVNELLLYNCELQSGFTQTGGDVFWYSVTIFGDITIHDQTSLASPLPNQPIDTRFFGSGGGSLDSGANPPNFTVTNDIPSPLSHNIRVDLIGFAVTGTLNIMGDGVNVGNTVVTSTADGVPSLARLSVTNNGQLVLLTHANGIGYEPSTPSNWASTPPATTQAALDRISSLLFTLNGNTPIP